MATEKQIAANRANALKSTGPKTEAGKQASSLNAVKHGLLAKMNVLKIEREPAFQELFETIIREVAPRNELEMGYVESMTVARWRTTRLWMMQTATLEIGIFDTPVEAGDDPVRLSLAFQSLADESNTLRLLQRYETANERLYNRSLNMILKLRGLKSGPLNTPVEAETKPAEPVAPAPAPAEPPKMPNKPDLPSDPIGEKVTPPARNRHAARLAEFRRTETARGLHRYRANFQDKPNLRRSAALHSL